MHRIQETSNVIIEINKYRKNEIKDYEIIKTVCGFYDRIKKDGITQSDLKFLKYISNVIGIPHYYDLLSKFDNKIDIDHFDLKTMSSLLNVAANLSPYAP